MVIAMKDFFGNKLKVGDSVVFMVPTHNTQIVGEVKEIIKDDVKVECDNTWDFEKENTTQIHVIPAKSCVKSLKRKVKV